MRRAVMRWTMRYDGRIRTTIRVEFSISSDDLVDAAAKAIFNEELPARPTRKWLLQEVKEILQGHGTSIWWDDDFWVDVRGEGDEDLEASIRDQARGIARDLFPEAFQG
jgi:hypothetical protein